MLLMTSCSTSNDRMILVDLPPICSIAKNIIPTYYISCMIPENFDPHSYELKPDDIKAIKHSEIYITIGLMVNAYEKEAIKNFDGYIINVSKEIEIIKYKDTIDTHVWLSIENAKRIAETIKEEMMKIDSKNSKEYEQNFKKFYKELLSLEYEFKEELKDCNKDIVITLHPSLTYLGREFGFKNVYILKAELSEPSAKEILEILRLIKEQNIKYILKEKNIETKVLEIITRETNVKVLEIDIMGGEEKEDYIRMMKKLLSALKIALECSK